MSKLFLLLFLASCATQSPPPVIEKPAHTSLFMNQYNVPGGKYALIKELKEYGTIVQTKLKGKKGIKEWFALCDMKVPKNFTIREALECHDRFVAYYFLDVNDEDIAIGKSDSNTVQNNIFMYPAIVMIHYHKIAETLPE